MRYARIERTIAGRVMSLETGRIARQAAGSCLASFGESVVLAATCSAPSKPGIDFFPLTVDYREKTYAAGKFPGGFIKREGRPKDKEVLTSRLIDRPIRPLWPEGYQDEVQILATVVSVDKENDPDVLAMNASFAATFLAPLPFQGPIAAVRVGRVDGQFVAFPTVQQMDDGDLDLVMAASRDALVMVEGQAHEIREEEFLAALDFGSGVIQQILDMMEELREKASPPECTWQAPEVEIPREYHQVKDEYADRLRDGVLVQGKHERHMAIEVLREQALKDLVPEDHEAAEKLKAWVNKGFKELESEVMRSLILDEGKRIDLRGPKDIRKITIETGVLPRTHGSALFTRGETQALVVTTLGTPRDQQIVDGLMEEYAKRFDLQYNFPPYSVGEVRAMRGVGRREIGHGNLAERALATIIPSEEKFPYTIRLVSDITESNGSSSMATVCGGTLALMDSGVSIRQPVAGIAMGLIKEGDRVAILSDILGTEDHLGDMDFKVAGTGRGINAVQMDIKIKGLSRAILEKALRQAKEGRLHILREMMKAMSHPRPEISKWAPRLLQVQIPVEKIGMVIGPGGKTIKKIQDDTGALVEIDDDGKACISSTDAEAAQAAKAMVEQLIAEVEVGRIYQGRVVSIKDFGAFVEVLPGQEGLCHVSELDESHVRSVSDVVSIGDVIPVKVILRDEQGRLKLSRRAALQESDGTARGAAAISRDESESRGPRGIRRPERGEDRTPRKEREWSGDRPGRGRERDERWAQKDRGHRDRERGRGREVEHERDLERGSYGERDRERESVRERDRDQAPVPSEGRERDWDRSRSRAGREEDPEVEGQIPRSRRTPDAPGRERRFESGAEDELYHRSRDDRSGQARPSPTEQSEDRGPRRGDARPRDRGDRERREMDPRPGPRGARRVEEDLRPERAAWSSGSETEEPGEPTGVEEGEERGDRRDRSGRRRGRRR